MTPIKTIPLPSTGYLRLYQIIGDPKADPPVPAIFPVGRSTWWKWVKLGYAPEPVNLTSKIRGWKTEDIQALIKRVGNKEWCKGKIKRKRGNLKEA